MRPSNFKIESVVKLMSGISSLQVFSYSSTVLRRTWRKNLSQSMSWRDMGGVKA